MKRLLLLVFLSPVFAHSLEYSEVDTKDKKIRELLTILHVKKFANSISKIKKYKSPSEIKELDYGLKPYFKNLKYWYYFDQIGFVKGLESKISKHFDYNQIKKLNKVFKNPFNVKVLLDLTVNRDLFNYYENTITRTYQPDPIPESRRVLMTNIFVLHGMLIQREYLEKRLDAYIKAGNRILKSLSKDNENLVYIDPVDLKKRRANSRQFLIRYLAQDLKKFGHYELREYIRVMKKDITAQKFIQLYVNYYFLYMMEYMEKVSSDKLEQLKALKIE